MNKNIDEQTYIFVIDTENYAGNFERKMCAYMTGKIGDCSVGKEEVSEFRKDMELDEDYDSEDNHLFEYVLYVFNDEDRCSRPCCIWSTPGWFNDGMGGHFKDGEEQKAKKHYEKACLDQAKTPVHKDDQKSYREEWINNSKKSLKKWPAYNSVAIFMEKRPSKKDREILFTRAKKFAKINKIKITGFRELLKIIKINEIECYSPNLK